LGGFLISPMHAICLAHFILLKLLTSVMSGEEYKLWSLISCSCCQPRVTSSLFGSGVLFGTPFLYWWA
jgi:hypothetical protein